MLKLPGSRTSPLSAAERVRPAPARVPGATYRLQFNHGFTLQDALGLVDYLHDLGVTDIYASPLTTARPGSMHGYDITDHARVNPELGDKAQLAALAERLRSRGMGLVLDVVPNHMCIAGSTNRWWLDVLENGPGSPYAEYFDIDWHPPTSPALQDKVLLPILGDQYGKVLENQEIRVVCQDGGFVACYGETGLPLAPRTWLAILGPALCRLRGELGGAHTAVLELESICTSLSHLPSPTERDLARVQERQRESQVARRRLQVLQEGTPAVDRAIGAILEGVNGRKGDPRSFDALEQLLADQCYRLSYWRVAADEINYRRFFDVNELAAIRVEHPQVFDAVHELALRHVAAGHVSGLRVDHVDGLRDPERYLQRLQQACQEALGDTGRPCYVVVEKILVGDEQLRPEWPIAGTTGYEATNLLNGLFVQRASHLAFRRLYQRFTGHSEHFPTLLYECKKLIMRVAMAGQVQVLAAHLDRISEQHRWSRDFTLQSLRLALREVIACFPVYRSYVDAHRGRVDDDDRRYIGAAIRQARRRNPATSGSLFDFLADVLLLQDPDGLSGDERWERREFVMHFQQLTGPITAKGLEDTAFYRYFPLASLDEVGGDPEQFGVSPRAFHARTQQRLRAWPHTLCATATHDTKRSEDVRARIDVLSELPREWERAIHRWRQLNRAHVVVADGQDVPDPGAEYLLYQTLVGAWPLEELDEAGHADFVARIQAYMHKATKEAKLHTSWINPDAAYDRALGQFVAAVLRRIPANRFLADLADFQRPIARCGLYNSLSQVLFKVAAPGVPDFYQGTEIWDFSLVDPDNRRPVDYAHRRALLAGLLSSMPPVEQASMPAMPPPEDPRVKLLVTHRALAHRRSHPDLFSAGDYRPLQPHGERRHHAVAFVRSSGRDVAIAVAGRFFRGLGAGGRPPTGPEVWGDTAVLLAEGVPGGRYRDVICGAEVAVESRGRRRALPLAQTFARLPVALLEPVP